MNKLVDFKSLTKLDFILDSLKWLIVTTIIALIIGSVSAFFLVSLRTATDFRENNLFIILLLPIGGLVIGYLYHYLGKGIEKGNNLLLEEYRNPQQTIPLKMAPLVFIGTILTHLFGGSAGREGTAVQMGGAIADQFNRFFRLNKSARKKLIIIGISAGFSSVFGTPLAGAIFGIEVLSISKINYKFIFHSLIAAIVANYACHLWNVGHTDYIIGNIPEINAANLFWVGCSGIAFGLTAMLFSVSKKAWKKLFQKTIKLAPLRPFFGGIIIAASVFLIGTTKYIGLGIPIIEISFMEQLDWYDFLIKLMLTAFTLGAGFKGGEVTPLFFIGAALGNALFLFVPLPLGLLAGIGFVGVFSGATNTPLACTFMGIELFGMDGGVFIGLSCFVAYLFSGKTSVYTAQLQNGLKEKLYANLKFNTNKPT
ncbi:MAG: voltage-gated chloride channel family protein [Bacteroidota bacterium]